jgi:hypothetical protein
MPEPLDQSEFLVGREKRAAPERVREIDNLYILIHPLFLVKEGTDTTQSMLERIYKEFAPKSDRDLIWFMAGPADKLWQWKQNVREARKFRPEMGESMQWPHLYRDLKRKYPEQIMFANNVVFAWNDAEKQMGYGNILERTKDKNLKIGHHTKVTVGGEYLDWCVSSGVMFLMEAFPTIEELMIDLRATTPSGTSKTKAIEDTLDLLEGRTSFSADPVVAVYDKENELIRIKRT